MKNKSNIFVFIMSILSSICCFITCGADLAFAIIRIKAHHYSIGGLCLFFAAWVFSCGIISSCCTIKWIKIFWNK